MKMQWEKMQSGQKKDKSLKARVGESAVLAQGARWARLSSGGIQAGEVRGGSPSAGRSWISRRSRDAPGKAAPGVRASKSSESRKGE